MKSVIAVLIVVAAVLSAPVAQCEEARAYVEPALVHPSYGDVKVVVPLSTSDAGIWKFKMANIDNALRAVARWGGKVDIRVVLYGSGLELLRSADADVQKTLSRLRGAGVRFLVCDNSLRHMDIDYHSLPGVAVADIVPSGFLEVAWLQQAQGYSVDPGN